MAWTAPSTAVANQVITAALWNQQVRDNMLETAVAKATAANMPAFFVTTGNNAITERHIAGGTVEASETTATTTYTDLTTPGPSVTVTIGAACIIVTSAKISNSGTGDTFATFAISGAMTLAESDARAVRVGGVTGVSIRASTTNLQTGLTPGSSTFTMRYRVSSGTGTYVNRRIFVIPL